MWIILPPGSLKAKLAVDRIREIIAFCEKNKINLEICDIILVASDERDRLIRQPSRLRRKKWIKRIEISQFSKAKET